MSTRGSSTASFDLRSERGIVDLLAVIRMSLLGTEEKRFLRDLVLAYTQSKGDKGIYDELTERIQQYNLSLELLQNPMGEQKNTASVEVAELAPPTESIEPVRLRSGFSSGRTVPTFTAHVVKEVHKEAVPTVPTAPLRATDVSSVATTPVPVVSSPRTVVEEAVSNPVPLAQSSQSVTTPVSGEGNVYLVRIQEIKSDINQKIGNPVNLVDIDNHVGREYMAALLDAMKAISNGGSPDDAMSRLESAYHAALRLIGSDTNTINRVIPVVPSSQSVSTQIIKPIMPQTPSVPVEEAASIPSVPPAKAVENIAAVLPVPSLNTQTANTPEQVPVPVPTTAVNLEVHSVAEAKPLRNITELPLANEVQTAPAGTDPLFTKEIDDGLDQLLSEWPLFSKSGLFGRGPSRRQHPLFVQLANMPIPLILTGRFEGATPQVMQSISDYMNGWRYEQGLIYDNDESFEHFLRRVIRHIINWQRKKKQA